MTTSVAQKKRKGFSHTVVQRSPRLGNKVLAELESSHPASGLSSSTAKASALVILVEALMLLGSGAALIWPKISGFNEVYGIYALGLIVASATILIAFYEKGLFTFNSICNPLGQIPKILKIITLTFFSFLALAFAFKVSEQFSRVWVFSWYGLSVTLILLERSLCYILCMKWAKEGRFSREIVIVGCGVQTKKFLDRLKKANEPWIKVAGVFDARNGRVGPTFRGYPVLGGLEDLLKFVRNNRVDDIVINLPWSADRRITAIVRKLEELPVHVCLGSDLAGFGGLHTCYSTMGGIPMLDVANKPLDGWRHFFKVLEDTILGSITLILFSPLMLLIAIAIKIESPGPVFFLQKRYGFNNKPFRVFKFRSMFCSEDLPERKVPQAVKNDPRVTTVGAFLRRTSLDELPQLLNVLNGTMSLVGPRPHAVEHNEEYSKVIDRYFSRHRVKPGITGWAQVNGLRGETNTLGKMEARVDHDIHYIESWSFWLDLRIIIMTLYVVVSQKNAY